MKSKVCLFQNYVDSFSHEQHRCTWKVQHAWVILSSSLSSSSLNWSPLSAVSPSLPLSVLSPSFTDQVQDQPTTQIDLFLQNPNMIFFILLIYTYIVIFKIINLLQKCVTIYSNIRTTHKYGNIIYRWNLKNI
jgi:hypothetical protein